MGFAIIAVVIGLMSGCGKASETASALNSKSSETDGWLVYEDDVFKTIYPPQSELSGARDGKQDPKNVYLSIVPPPHDQGGIGGFHLLPDGMTKNMLLRDALQSDIARFKGDKGLLIAGPKDVTVGNGRCITALVVAPADSCPKNAGSCYSPLYVTQCDGPNGARYNAHTALSAGPARNALSPRAQTEARVYELILRSLEFKKS